MENPEKEATELLMRYEDRFSAEEFNQNQEGYATAGRPSSFWRRLLPWCIHLGLIATYSSGFFAVRHREKVPSGVFSLVDSPASYVGKETHLEVFDIQGKPHGIYTGAPRPELDQAWRDLLQYNNIRVSGDWVRAYGREGEAVQLPDGGYLGMLSVFHELHCIKRLYQTLYPDHYYPNASDAEIRTNLEHNQHCLEVLRMGATCRGDVSLITHMWTDVNALPIVNQTARHQCVDFKKVMEYSASESVDVYQPGYIVHPKFGPSFPGGNSIKPFESPGEHEHVHIG